MGVFFNKEKPKHMKKALEALLPLSICSFLLFYCCALHLPSFLQNSIKFSTTVKGFIGKKTMFLLCNSILLFVAKDLCLPRWFTFANDIYNEKLLTIEDRVNSGSNSVEFEVHVREKGVVNGLYNSNEPFARRGGLVEEDDSKSVTKSVVCEKGVVNDPYSCNELFAKTGGLVEEDDSKSVTVAAESLEIVVVEESREIVELSSMEEDDMEKLHLEELNRRFEEFIQKENKKRRMEALHHHVMV